MSGEVPDQGASHLDQVIARFLDAEERGQPIAPKVLLEENPELAAELASFFDEHQALKRGKQVDGFKTTPYVKQTPFVPPEVLDRPKELIQPDQVLGDVRILRELGRGGMGVVYLGEHIRLKDLRAVKILPRYQVTDDAIRRFWKEAKTAAGMNHLHIVNIHDVGHDQDLHYIIMQHVDGRTLNDHLDHHMVRSDGKPLSGDIALRLMVPVLDALAAMHSRGIIHRDIKPSNIMVTGAVSRKAHVVLMDFGLIHDESDGRMTNPDAIVGTPGFMAREQALGDNVDARCDLYAVGATLYYLLTGHAPYEGKRGDVLMRAAQGSPPAPLRELRADLSESVCSIVEKAMQPICDNRYSRAADMLKDITETLKRPTTKKRTGVRPASKREVPDRKTSSQSTASPKQETISTAADSSKIEMPLLVPLESGEVQLPQQSSTNYSSAVSSWAPLHRLLYLNSRHRTTIASAIVLGTAALVVIVLIALRPAPSANSKQSQVSGVATDETSSKTTTRDDMIRIPNGFVQLGATEAQLRAHATTLDVLKDDAKLTDQFVTACLYERRERVSVSEFWIDKYEVTNEEYSNFVKATGYPAPPDWEGANLSEGQDNHPITKISHKDASAYAHWAGKKLPTVAQWMRAFRGDDERMYPWGDQWDSNYANVVTNTSFASGTSPVDSSPHDISPFGVLNLVGGVDEITRGRVIRDGQEAAVIKGGHSECRGEIYGAAPFEFFVVGEGPLGKLTGFRCVIEEEE